MQDRGYQRKYLRAPYSEEILFSDRNFVFKARALNISESGLLLDFVGHFPKETHSPFLLKLPGLPKLQNFNLAKLEHYSAELYKPVFVRFMATMVRSIQASLNKKIDIRSEVGLRIDEICPVNQKKIATYVESFASNLIHLQVLIDTLDADKNNILKARRLSEILGYESGLKMSLLRIKVEHDYKSLQWL